MGAPSAPATSFHRQAETELAASLQQRQDRVEGGGIPEGDQGIEDPAAHPLIFQLQGRDQGAHHFGIIGLQGGHDGRRRTPKLRVLVAEECDELGEGSVH